MRHLLTAFAFLLVLGTVTVSAQPATLFEQPVLITSAGQSADVTMAGMICKRVKVEAKAAPTATEADLKGFKTLMIVPGFSSKGLGAAGTSREQEMDRIRKVIDAAKKNKMRIMMVHIGGKARRGAQSDDFNELAMVSSEYAIVVKAGDEDGFFAAIAKKHNIPLEAVDRIPDAQKPVEAAFAK